MPYFHLQMQNQHQVLTAPMLLPVTEAKEAQGTSQSNSTATGRTSVLSTEIRAEEISQHISPAMTFCTLQFGSPAQPENVPEAGRCKQLATSLRVTKWNKSAQSFANRLEGSGVGSCPGPLTCQIWWWSSLSLSDETSSRDPCPPGWPWWSSAGRAPGWGMQVLHMVL